MDGETIVFTLLSGHTPLVAVVPEARIVVDDALPSGSLPAVQIETVSSTDKNRPNRGASFRVRQRIRIRIHATDGTERAQVRGLVRAALRANRFPTIDGASSVTVDSDGEGPNGIAPESNVRVGIQDVFVTYLENS
ncbi:hypothetical protein [Rhizorhabdus sp.]|uniref:tail completion protein gp17 n=1 Tax=Rhizorhabdus sp. TaxID=1968843 RepID=UPI00198F22B4|nr:hypothetical protein [Rhizorhabdus sp.]MBD3762465.1 hypothetical protein [Rhizorhabdus sp.]